MSTTARKPRVHRTVKRQIPVNPGATVYLDGTFCPVCPTGHRGHIATDGRSRWCCRCGWYGGMR